MVRIFHAGPSARQHWPIQDPAPSRCRVPTLIFGLISSDFGSFLVILLWIIEKSCPIMFCLRFKDLGSVWKTFQVYLPNFFKAPQESERDGILRASVYPFPTGNSNSTAITKSLSYSFSVKPLSPGTCCFWQYRNQSGSAAETIYVKGEKSTGCFKYQQGTLKFSINFFSWPSDIFNLKLYCLTSRHFARASVGKGNFWVCRKKKR